MTSPFMPSIPARLTSLESNQALMLSNQRLMLAQQQKILRLLGLQEDASSPTLPPTQHDESLCRTRPHGCSAAIEQAAPSRDEDVKQFDLLVSGGNDSDAFTSIHDDGVSNRQTDWPFQQDRSRAYRGDSTGASAQVSPQKTGTDKREGDIRSYDAFQSPSAQFGSDGQVSAPFHERYRQRPSGISATSGKRSNRKRFLGSVDGMAGFSLSLPAPATTSRSFGTSKTSTQRQAKSQRRSTNARQLSGVRITPMPLESLPLPTHFSSPPSHSPAQSLAVDRSWAGHQSSSGLSNASLTASLISPTVYSPPQHHFETSPDTALATAFVTGPEKLADDIGAPLVLDPEWASLVPHIKEEDVQQMMQFALGRSHFARCLYRAAMTSTDHLMNLKDAPTDVQNWLRYWVFTQYPLAADESYALAWKKCQQDVNSWRRRIKMYLNQGKTLHYCPERKRLVVSGADDRRTSVDAGPTEGGQDDVLTLKADNALRQLTSDF